MQTNNTNNTVVLRFRRWSRAGYAVFCSLTRAVTIGRLEVSIADKSLQKSTGSSVYMPFVSLEDSSEEKEKQNELEATLQQLNKIILSEITLDQAAACGRQANYFIIHQNG